VAGAYRVEVSPEAASVLVPVPYTYRCYVPYLIPDGLGPNHILSSEWEEEEQGMEGGVLCCYVAVCEVLRVAARALVAETVRTFAVSPCASPPTYQSQVAK